MGKKLNFENAMEKLHKITEKLENEDESLENTIKLYQEGMDLAKYCMDELNNAEQKIKIIETNSIEQDDAE